MDQHSITFTVDLAKNTIHINPKKTDAKPGDGVMFKSTNDTVHVDFQGAWPFTEPSGTIVVPGQGNTGYYHIAATAPEGLDDYTVSTAGGATQAVGQIDIEPAHV